MQNKNKKKAANEGNPDEQIVYIFINQAVLGNVAGWASTLELGSYHKTVYGRDVYDFKQNENRANLIAFLSALRLLKKSSCVWLFTYSKYVGDGIVNGFEGEDNKNQSLWSECAKYAKPHEINFVVCHPDSDLEEMKKLKKLSIEQI